MSSVPFTFKSALADSSQAWTIGLACTFALFVQQIFRRFETYNICTHLALLLIPPHIVALTTTTYVSGGGLVAHILYLSYTAFLATLSLSILIYRLSPIHPLARYPGPIGCKVSKLWMAAISRSGYQHRYYKALHERYGNVVRIGPNELSIREPSAVMLLLGAKGVPKGPHGIGRMLTTENLPMLGIQDTCTHLFRRRAWNRAFSSNAVAEYEDLVATRVRQLVDCLEALAHKDEEVRFERWMNFFSYDAMCDMTFGGGSELLREGDKSNVWSVLNAGMTAMTFFGHVPWLGVYCGYIPAATKPIKTLVSRCEEFVARRIKRGASIRDLFHYLNHEDLPETLPPPASQVVSDGILAIVGGSDTVSGALTSLFFCLLSHPKAYESLQAEVDCHYPAGTDVYNTKWHRKMKYLDAVINETIRLFPPGVGGSQRQIPAGSSGVTIGSMYIPPGTAFWVNAYSLHRDPANFFPFPEDFWPDRWIIASSNTNSFSHLRAQHAYKPDGFAHNEDAYMPFSHGPMNCVGKNFALMEVRMVVCALMQRLRFHLHEGYDLREYEREFKDFLVGSRPPLPVVIEVRK